MPTQERQQEHIRLSELLKALGLRHYEELPKGSVSLSLTVTNSKVDVKAFDGLGKQIGTIPNDTTSSSLRSALERTFGGATLPDEPVIAIISNPTTTTAT
jgi:hypothetical protein